MDDVVTNLPNQIKLLPYYCDDCCRPERASLSLGLRSHFVEMIFLKSGPLRTKSAVKSWRQPIAICCLMRRSYSGG
jgi:hypothetical protein